MTSFEVWRRLQKFQTVRPPVRGQYTRRETGKQVAAFLFGLLVLVAGLGATSFLVYKGLSRSDFFQITAIKIDGCRRTSKSMILERSDIDIHSNLLSLQVDKVREAIMADEWVRKVVIDRHWPNRLTITITERVPVALINLPGGLHYLDQQGHIFARVLPPEDLDFPVLTGFESIRLPEPAKREALVQALAFVQLSTRGNTALPKQNLSELHFSEKGELRLHLVNQPIPIHLGRGDLTAKYHRLAKVLDWLYRTDTLAETAYIRMDYGSERVLVGKKKADQQGKTADWQPMAAPDRSFNNRTRAAAVSQPPATSPART